MKRKTTFVPNPGALVESPKEVKDPRRHNCSTFDFAPTLKEI
jgi:hypothetical protein